MLSVQTALVRLLYKVQAKKDFAELDRDEAEDTRAYNHYDGRYEAFAEVEKLISIALEGLENK